MSTEIARREQPLSGALSLAPMNPPQAWSFAESLSNSPLLPDAYRRQPASVLWALEYGRALGLDVITTITTIHVIKGKPTQSADLMLSRTRAAGHKVRITQKPGECTASIWRSDDPDFEHTVTWTYDDAVTARLCTLDQQGRPYSRSKDKGEPQNWEKYPRAMLRARAISECVRMACPEVLHGAIYTPEEVGAVVDEQGNPVDAPVHPLRVVEHEVVREQPAGPSAAQGIAAKAAATADRAALEALRDEAQSAGASPDDTITAPDTGEQDTLREYLKRRWTTLPKPGEQQDAGEVVEGEIVPDPLDAVTQAEQRLRAAAKAAGLDNLEEEFEASYGLPLSESGATQLNEMAGHLEAAS